MTSRRSKLRGAAERRQVACRGRMCGPGADDEEANKKRQRRLPEYPKLTFTLGPQVVCLESLPQVRQQASALAGQLYKALIHVIVTQRGGHLRGALTNADVLEKSRMLEDDAYHNDWSPIECAPTSYLGNLCPKVGSFGTRWRLFFCGSAAPSYESIRHLSRGCPKLEVGKPCNERGPQKLEMPNGHSQIVQSPLPIYDLGAEQILIVIVLRIAR